jgi:hypothetical protein
MGAYRGSRENFVKKYERLKGLEALLATHEAMPEKDHAYIRSLCTRIRQIRTQLAVMSDVKDSDIGLSDWTE